MKTITRTAFVIVCGLLTCVDAAWACDWTGASATTNHWSDAANWTNCNGGAPTAGMPVSLTFPDLAPRQANVNDIAGLILTNVTIQGGGAGAAHERWDITGTQSVIINGDLSANTSIEKDAAGPSFRVPIVAGDALRIVNGTAGIPVKLFQVGDIAVPVNGMVFNAVEGPIEVVGQVSGDAGGALSLGIRILGGDTVTLSNPQNTWPVWTVVSGTLQVGAAGAIPAAAVVTLSINPNPEPATFDLNGFDVTVASLAGTESAHVLLGAKTLTVNPGDQSTSFQGTIAGTGNLVKDGAGTLTFAGAPANTYTGRTTLKAGTLELEKTAVNGAIVGPITISGGELEIRVSDQIADTVAVTVVSEGKFGLNVVTQPVTETIGSLAGDADGRVFTDKGTLTVGANNLSTTFAGQIFGSVPVGNLPPDAHTRFVKVGNGTFQLPNGALISDGIVVAGGALIANGTVRTSGVTVLHGAFLAGQATFLDPHNNPIPLSAAGGTIAPGDEVGVVHAGDASFTQGGTLDVELDGTGAGTGYDQLDLTGNLTLSADAQLSATLAVKSALGSKYTIVNLSGTGTVTGTFAGLPEGATLTIGDQQFTISYHGGDGNDVVLTTAGKPDQITYYLSEGATGPFFDEDILIANPNDTDAPVTLTFSKEDGSQVVDTRNLPAKSRLTVHVDAIAGMESTAASAQVTSTTGVPLLVERTMFWDKSYYAGSTGSSVDRPSQDWFFAEGSQGFFSTFVLVNNPNATPTDVTFTFLPENATPVTKTVTVGPTTRLTLDCGSVPAIVNQSFGISVHATQPIMAERSMYFGTTPTRLWSGGTESAGVTSTSTNWFLAEGATGGFFDTFILLSNPQDTLAIVEVKYLLDSGDTVDVFKNIQPHARLTTNIATEDDARLHNAAVSTVVSSNVPIIAERSMYWPGAAQPWGEGHNSFGVTEAGTKWGLAEGRTGGPFNYHTYILLANPQTTAANVTITFLREGGAAPVVKTYTVLPTSRFNVDSATVPELHDENFGAIIEVTNNQPIIVERSLYWDSNGFQFSGGTNATGIRLP